MPARGVGEHLPEHSLLVVPVDQGRRATAVLVDAERWEKGSV
jgi:hypothetical protein